MKMEFHQCSGSVPKANDITHLESSHQMTTTEAVFNNNFILFQEGDIYITIVNHDGPRKERRLN